MLRMNAQSNIPDIFGLRLRDEDDAASGDFDELRPCNNQPGYLR